jgi:hypothetical protein
MGRRRALGERLRAGLWVFTWEALIVVAAAVIALGVSVIVLALV